MKKLLAIIALLAATAAAAQEPKRTVVAGRVENGEGLMRVSLENPIDLRGKILINLDQTGGDFHIASDYLFPQEMSFTVGDRQVWAFVSPGDSLFVKLDMAGGKVEFRGKQAKLSKEIDQWKHSTNKEHHQKNIQWVIAAAQSDSLDTEELRAKLKDDFDQTNATIAKSGMSKQARQWAQTSYKFGFPSVLELYNDTWSVLTDAELFDPWNRANLQSSMFVGHLMNQAKVLMRELDASTPEEMVAGLVGAMNDSIPDPLLRDLILWEIARELLQFEEYTPEQLALLRENFNTPLFARLLDDNVARIERERNTPIEDVALGKISIVGGDDVVAAAENTGFIDMLRERHKGKVVYIDMWCTSCAPCIVALRGSNPLLHKRFEGREGVVFVYLCVDSSPNDWLANMARIGMGREGVGLRLRGENYLLDATDSELFMYQYGLRGYPSYFIIAPDGTLINHAPNPTAAGEKIEELLTPNSQL